MTDIPITDIPANPIPANPNPAHPCRRARSAVRRDIESLSSGQLALAARDGDDQAAGELYRRTVRRARAAARCFCNDADADDAVAEGMCRALVRLAQLQDPDAVESWMIRCVVRAALDLTRRGQRQQPSDAVDALSDAATPPGESAADRALSTLERRTMTAVVDQLAAGPRLLLQLRYEAGLSVEHIAVALGRPAGTVRRQCFEARRMAAQCFLGRQLRPAHGPCAPITELLCQATSGRCSALATRRVDDHLRRCQDCQDRRRELAALLADYGGVRMSPERAA